MDDLFRCLIYLAINISPGFFSYRCVGLPGELHHLSGFSTFHVPDLDIGWVALLGIHYHTLSPIKCIVVIIGHELIEIGHQNTVVYRPVKPYQFRLIFIDQFIGMGEPFTGKIICIFFIFVSSAIQREGCVLYIGRKIHTSIEKPGIFSLMCR